jgi:hypothetical protein
VVQEMLGYSSILLTADTRTSVLPEVAPRARTGLVQGRKSSPKP